MMVRKIDLRLFLKEACFFGLVWQLLVLALEYKGNPVLFNPLLADYFVENIIAREALLVAVFSIVFYMIVRSFLALLFAYLPRLGFFAAAVIYSSAVSVYVFSWMQFQVYEKFINFRSIEMFLASPWQILRHSEDVAQLSIMTIALVPATILVTVFAFKYLLLDRVSSKFVFSAFLAVNIILVPFNLIKVDMEQYSEVYIYVHDTPIAVVDHMHNLTVNSAGPMLTLKESMLSLHSSGWAVDADKLSFQDIVPLDQASGFYQSSTIKKWDVVIIEVESLSPDLFGGDLGTILGQDTMPAVSEIAAESLVFTNVFGQSSHSSYADLVPLSSQYPLRTKSVYIYPKNIVYPRVLIYDLLHQFGFATAIISSQNEEWQGMNNYLQTPNLETFIHAANYQDTVEELGLKRDGLSIYEGASNFVSSFSGKMADHSTVTIVNAWLDTLEEDKNYFLYTNLQNSHMPFYTEPDKKLKLFKSREEQDLARERRTLSDSKQLYMESMNGIDEQIQRIVEHLKQIGRWDQTLMVITADTSILFASHQIGNGANLNKAVLHVPLIIKVPGMAPGEDTRLMQHLDVAPTVLGYMGLEKHPGFQGRDFSDKETCNSYSFAVAKTAVADQYSVNSTMGVRMIYDVSTRQVHLESLLEGVDLEQIKTETGGELDRLFAALETWVGGQIGYYENSLLMAEKYPPQFKFGEECH